MKVTNEQIEALRRIADGSAVDSHDRAWEIIALCDIALDGYSEDRPAIEYARAHGLQVTAVPFLVSGDASAVSPDRALELLNSHHGYRVELFPGREAVDAAREECAELIAALLAPKAQEAGS